MNVLSKRTRAITMGITSVPGIAFIICSMAILLDIAGFSSASGIADFFFEELLGILFLSITGLSLFLFLLMIVIHWDYTGRLERIRYLTAAYLIHSGITAGRRIPLGEMSERIGVPERDLAVALQVMLDRKEVKGRIDRAKDEYIHGSVPKKGKRLTMFLSAGEISRFRSSEKRNEKEKRLRAR